MLKMTTLAVRAVWVEKETCIDNVQKGMPYRLAGGKGLPGESGDDSSEDICLVPWRREGIGILKEGQEDPGLEVGVAGGS